MVHRHSKDLSKNFIIKVVLVGVVIFVGLFLIIRQNRVTYPSNISIFIKDQGYYLEVAHTKKDQQKGLSNRDNLCFNCGMIFVFNKSGKHPFWMKDTHIPLDMIWLDSKFQVVKIITAIKTDSEDIYTNDKAAKYVIELNANDSLKLGLKVGDTIEIPKF